MEARRGHTGSNGVADASPHQFRNGQCRMSTAPPTGTSENNRHPPMWRAGQKMGVYLPCIPPAPEEALGIAVEDVTNVPIRVMAEAVLYSGSTVRSDALLMDVTPI